MQGAGALCIERKWAAFGVKLEFFCRLAYLHIFLLFTLKIVACVQCLPSLASEHLKHGKLHHALLRLSVVAFPVPFLENTQLD